MSAPKVVSLFTGAGGMDLGLEAAGFDMSVAVELNADAVATVRANRDWNILHRNVHNVPSAELLAESGLVEGEADLLVGGPPCQPFSKSGYWHSGDSKRLDDERAGTLHAYLRVLRDLKPRAFMLENVPGLAFSSKDEGIQLIRRTIEQINCDTGTSYSLVARQLNAANFGVPQTRERVFVIGQRDGEVFRFPSPTHEAPSKRRSKQPELLDGPPLKPAATAWDAIGHLQDSVDPTLTARGKWADLLPSIPEGQNYLCHTARGGGLEIFGWRRRYWSMLLKLAKNRPSWTLTAQPGPAIGPFHWKNRRLSARELCALQTFPSDYVIHGSLQAAYRQVGNAVPSGLAEQLGVEIRRQLLSDKSCSLTGTSLLPPAATFVPPAEPVLPVDLSKYREEVGKKAAHPGTGKGPRGVRSDETLQLVG